MRKIISLATLLATMQYANAGIIEEYHLSNLAKNTGDISAQDKIRSSMLKSEKSARNWIQSWSHYEDQPLYPDTWGEIGFNLLRWTQPGKSYDWKSSKKLESQGKFIYQQDSLIDLERIKVAYASYGEATGIIHKFSIADTSKPKNIFIGTSQRRLSLGMPPIGPDNEEVVVCKIGRSSMAPYVEISKTQQSHFSSTTGISFSYCLTGKDKSSYWKARYNDFLYKDYNRKDSHNPGSSW